MQKAAFLRKSKGFTPEAEILKIHLKQTNAQICPASIFMCDKEGYIWGQWMVVVF